MCVGEEPIERCLEVRWRRKWGRKQFGDQGNDSEDNDEVQGPEGGREGNRFTQDCSGLRAHGFLLSLSTSE